MGSAGSKNCLVPLNIDCRSQPGKEPEKGVNNFTIISKSLYISLFTMIADSPPPLEGLIINNISEPELENPPAEAMNEENNVVGFGAWPQPVGGANEGAGYWGEHGGGLWGEHTEATWRTAPEWGSEVRVGLRPDFDIRASDHLDHLPTESWARIQREC